MISGMRPPAQYVHNLATSGYKIAPDQQAAYTIARAEAYAGASKEFPLEEAVKALASSQAYMVEMLGRMNNQILALSGAVGAVANHLKVPAVAAEAMSTFELTDRVHLKMDKDANTWHG